MTNSVDVATELSDAGPGRFSARVDPQWSVAGRTNGGYLLALLGRAAAVVSPPHVLAASATYLSPVPPGEVELVVEVLREGRSTSVLRVGLRTPDGQPRVEALVTCGRLAASAEPFHDGVEPAALPAIADCTRLPPRTADFEVPLMGVVAVHLDPDTLGWAQGRPSGQGELRGHLALADGRESDPLSLLLAVDALPPTSFDLGLAGMGSRSGSGHFALQSGLRFDAGTRGLHLDNPEIVNVEVPALGGAMNGTARSMLNSWLLDYAREEPVYRLDDSALGRIAARRIDRVDIDTGVITLKLD